MKSKKQKFTVTFEPKCYTYVTPKECSNNAALMPFLRQCYCNILKIRFIKQIGKVFKISLFSDVTVTFR